LRASSLPAATLGSKIALSLRIVVGYAVVNGKAWEKYYVTEMCCITYDEQLRITIKFH